MWQTSTEQKNEKRIWLSFLLVGGLRDESTGHDGGPIARFGGHHGGSAERVAGAGDLLALGRPRRLRPHAQRARWRAASIAGQWRTRHGRLLPRFRVVSPQRHARRRRRPHRSHPRRGRRRPRRHRLRLLRHRSVKDFIFHVAWP